MDYNTTFYYIIGGFIALMLFYYIFIIPKMKKKMQGNMDDFERKNVGKEEQFKEELLNNDLQFIQSKVNEKIISLTECLNYRTAAEIAKEFAASTARSLAQRAVGGKSRDVNRVTYQSYLCFGETQLHYVEFDEDDFEMTKRMSFNLSEMKTVLRKKGIKQTTNLMFDYQEKSYKLSFYPGIMAFGGFGKELRELSLKSAFSLVKPFIEKVNTISTEKL